MSIVVVTRRYYVPLVSETVEEKVLEDIKGKFFIIVQCSFFSRFVKLKSNCAVCVQLC